MTIDYKLSSEKNSNESGQLDENDLYFFMNNDKMQEQISNAARKYMLITEEKLSESEKKQEIKSYISDFVMSNKISEDKIDSLDSFAKIAFSRLANISKKYYMEKTLNKNSSNIEKLKNTTQRLKRDYDLIMSLF